MAVDKLVDSTQLDSDLTSVANAIRTKGGTSAQLAFPAGFVREIDAIPTGGTLITKTITENGTYDAEDDDADGYSEVTVNVSGGGGGSLKSGTITPAERTMTLDVNLGSADTITNAVIVPASETPLKSAGRTVFAMVIINESYKKSIVCGSNSGGSSLFTPVTYDGSKISQSGSTLTFNGGGTTSYYFETVLYRWFAW